MGLIGDSSGVNKRLFGKVEAQTWAATLALGNATDGTGTHKPTITAGDQLVCALGVVGAPTVAFAGDLSTGIWSGGAGRVTVSSVGVQVADFDSDGLALTGTLDSTASVETSLSVAPTVVHGGTDAWIGADVTPTITSEGDGTDGTGNVAYRANFPVGYTSGHDGTAGKAYAFWTGVNGVRSMSIGSDGYFAVDGGTGVYVFSFGAANSIQWTEVSRVHYMTMDKGSGNFFVMKTGDSSSELTDDNGDQAFLEIRPRVAQSLTACQYGISLVYDELTEGDGSTGRGNAAISVDFPAGYAKGHTGGAGAAFGYAQSVNGAATWSVGSDGWVTVGDGGGYSHTSTASTGNEFAITATPGVARTSDLVNLVGVGPNFNGAVLNLQSDDVGSYLLTCSNGSADVLTVAQAGPITLGDTATLVGPTATGDAGTDTIFNLSGTVNQGGTAGYTCLQIAITESATGSGDKQAIRAKVGGTDVFRVDRTGMGYFANDLQLEGGATKLDYNAAYSGGPNSARLLAGSTVPAALVGADTNAADSVGCFLWNSTALATAGAKLISSGSGTTEYFAVGYLGLVITKQGTDLASANNMAAPTANYVDVTGTTQINTMAVGSAVAGTFVTLQFDSNPTVKHATAGTGAQFQLSGAVDFAASAGDTLMVVYDGTYWREVSRTMI